MASARTDVVARTRRFRSLRAARHRRQSTLALTGAVVSEAVRSMPDAMPNASGGAAFITDELLAGKKKLAPMPLMMLASTTPTVR